MRSAIAGPNEAKIRVAVSAISARLATASERAAAALGSVGEVSIVDRAAVAASRSTVRLVASSSSRWSIRPAGAFWDDRLEAGRGPLPALRELRVDQLGDPP